MTANNVVDYGTRAYAVNGTAQTLVFGKVNVRQLSAATPSGPTRRLDQHRTTKVYGSV